MAGNPDNASLWQDADVYIGATKADVTPLTADGDMPAGARLVGLLSGDAGFTNTRDMESNDFYAWGGILVRRSHRNITVRKGFTLLEDNAATRDIVWPGSSSTGLVVPRPSRQFIAFELREGDRVRRQISVRPAELMLDGDFSESEGDLTQYAITASFFPDGDGLIFELQDTQPQV